MKRILIALLVGGAVFAAVFGAAASLGVNGGAIQAGTDSDLRCDTDGVVVLGWGLNSVTGLVENVRIGDVSGDCVGKSLQARIDLSTGGPYITAGGNGVICAPGYWVNILGTEPTNGYRLCFQTQAGVFTSAPAENIEALTVFIE